MDAPRCVVTRKMRRMTSAPKSDGSFPGQSDALFDELYHELHRLARREAARFGPALGFSPTTLLHEAYLDMSQRAGLRFEDRAKFFAYAARAMRTLAIDRARQRSRKKRGGGLDITSLDTQTAEDCAEPETLSQLAEALDQLAILEPELATVVDLKFFCGFTIPEIATLQGVSERTVQRHWEKARTLLFHMLGP